MSEATTIDPGETDQNPRQAINADIEVKGLPYVVTAEVPEKPGHFTLLVSLPEEKWAETASIIGKQREDSDFDRWYRNSVQNFELGDGNVGSVFVNAAEAADGFPSIYVMRIQSNTSYFPEDNPYQKAKGVGSATLDSLCAIADVRGWRIYLEPVERAETPWGMDLYGWYQDHGFTDEFDYQTMHSSSGGMMRPPQVPNPTDPVVQQFEDR